MWHFTILTVLTLVFTFCAYGKGYKKVPQKVGFILGAVSLGLCIATIISGV